MSAFLAHAAALGVTMRPDGDVLRVSAPAGRVTDELRTRIAALKPRILAALATYPCTACQGPTRFDRPTVCYWCRTPRIPT